MGDKHLPQPGQGILPRKQPVPLPRTRTTGTASRPSHVQPVNLSHTRYSTAVDQNVSDCKGASGYFPSTSKSGGVQKSQSFAIGERPNVPRWKNMVSVEEEEGAVAMQGHRDSSFEELEFEETEHLKKLSIIIPVYLQTLKRQSSIDLRDRIETISVLLDNLVKGQTIFVLNGLSAVQTPEMLLDCFSRNEQLFLLYRKFCQDKCSFIDVSMKERGCNIKISLRQLLNERLAYYKNVLNKIKDIAELSSEADEVIKLIDWCYTNLETQKEKPSRVALRSPFDFNSLSPGDELPRSLFAESTPSQWGHLLLTEELKVTFPDLSERRFMVHLFGKVILFTKEQRKKRYLYYMHINMDEICLIHNAEKQRVIEFQHFTDQQKLLYRMEAKSSSSQLRWRNNISNILYLQYLEIKKKECNGFYTLQ